MTREYNLSHRLIACVLLISLLLQSCNNPSIPSMDLEEKPHARQDSIKEQPLRINSYEHDEALDEPTHMAERNTLIVAEDKLEIDQPKEAISTFSTQQYSSNTNNRSKVTLFRRSDSLTVKKAHQEKRIRKSPTIIQSSSTKEQRDNESPYIFKILQGHQIIKIYQHGARLEAKIRGKIGVIKGEPYLLPVYFEPGISLKQLVHLPKPIQEQYIHIVLPKPSMEQAGYVYIGKDGLLGGGNSSIKGEKREEGEKEKELEKEDSAEALFQKWEILCGLCEEGHDEYLPTAMDYLTRSADQGYEPAIALLGIKRLSRSVKSNQENFEEKEKEKEKEEDLTGEKEEKSIRQTFYRTYKDALEDLPNNNPKKTGIDLRQEQLSQENIKALEQALDENFVVGYIAWGEVPEDCKKLQKKIDKKLVQNICNYTYHPNDYMHGLLAQHVYSDPKKDEEIDFKDLCKKLSKKSNHELVIELPKDVSICWKVKRVRDDIQNSGFYSALYVNKTTHQAVLSFQGTYTETIKRLIKDLAIEDMQGILGNAITRQQALAYEETKAAVEYIKRKGFNLSFTGHSLGGYLAELGVAFCYRDFDCRQVKAIVFDSPGTDKKLSTFQFNVMNPSTELDISCLPITAYLSAPNLVNVCNGHAGEVYRVYPTLKWDGWLNKLEKLSNNLPIVGAKVEAINKSLRATIPGHYLYIMLSLFDANTGKPKEYVRMADWPALNKDVTKYVGKQSTGVVIGNFLGSRMAGPVGGLIGTGIGAGLLGNLGALGSVASVLLDCRNIDQTQFWATHAHLDRNYREINLESIEEFKHKYVGHYRVSPISIDVHPLHMDGYESIDGFLYALWEDREAISQLKTNDITGAVLKNILQDYTVKTIADKPCLRLEQNPIQIQVLRDKMQRTKEILTSDRIKKALKHSKNQAVCKHVEQELRKQFQEEQSKKLHRLHSYLPVAKEADYIPREDQEKKLARGLEEKGICVVHGHGGVGKSTLVAEYGHKLKDQQIVCWTQAETAEKLIASYEYAAREMGVSEEHLTYLKKEAGPKYLTVLARAVYNKLIDHQQPVLLILDNATDLTLIKDCLLHRPDVVKVIITTRDGDRKNFKEYNRVKLGPFTEEEGKNYIQQRLQPLNPGETDIQALIKEVGCIPKKLELATAYISEIGLITIPSYIEKLQELKKQCKKQQGELVLPEAKLGLNTLDSQAQLLMRYGAYLDPDFIPLSLIKILLGVNDEEKLGKLLSSIEKLSLVTIINNSRQIGIQIHREVQAACKAYQDWRAEIAEGAGKLREQDLLVLLIQVLGQHMPNVTEMPDNTWDQARIYANSVTAVVANAMTAGVVYPLLADLLDRTGDYNNHVCCNYQGALEYRKQALKMMQAFYSGNHPHIAASLNNIGNVYFNLGQNQEALKYYGQALEIYQALYTGNHPHIATFLNNIGNGYSGLGQNQEALKYHEQALQMRKDLYTGNHPDIATSLNNIGNGYLDLGQNQEALKYLEQALEMRNALYSGNHPHIAISLNNIGTVYANLGQNQEVLKYYEQALKMRNALYSGNHPDIASSFHNIGNVYYRLGQNQEALKYHEQALEMYQALYGGNHPHIANTLNNIGNDYKTLGQNREALKYHEQALEIRKALYSGNHPDIATSLNNIGNGYLDLGQNQEALKYYEQALEMRKALYSGNHPAIATSLNNIGSVYLDLGQNQEALKYYAQALEMYQALYSGNHSDIESVKRNIARLEAKQ